MKRLAVMMPGQGSQFVGMGRDLAVADARAMELFERADRVLGVPLSRICWEGPVEELTRTENAQPAILLHSVRRPGACCPRKYGRPSRLEPDIRSESSLPTWRPDPWVSTTHCDSCGGGES